MNGIHCRTGDLTESGKYLQYYGYICIVPPNLSTDIYSGRLLIHTNGGLSKWIVKRTFTNKCKKSCGISSFDMPQLFSSYANPLPYFSFISVFHSFLLFIHFCFSSFLFFIISIFHLFLFFIISSSHRPPTPVVPASS